MVFIAGIFDAKLEDFAASREINQIEALRATGLRGTISAEDPY